MKKQMEPQTPLSSLLLDMEVLEVQTNYDFQESWRTLKVRVMTELGMLRPPSAKEERPPQDTADKEAEHV